MMEHAWRCGLRGGLMTAFVALQFVLALGQHSLSHAEQRRMLANPTPADLSWPAIVRPRAGSPNILLVLTDDVGFGSTSTFGGPVPTPNFERIARRGLRYNQFHTTALCSPTRGALLTGRHPNKINLGNVTNLATGFAGFNSLIPRSAATVAQLLRAGGYATAMFGKSHLTPEWEQSAAGPFDRWPTGLGFDYFYGFLNADTSQYAPSLVENTAFLEPPYDDPDYFFERDMADKAIRWMRQQRANSPGRPFFMYYAPGTAHAPHHAPRDWIARFKGRFDQGWDAQRERTFADQKRLGVIPANAKLTARPDVVPSWQSLSVEQRRVAARYMEAYAAAIAYMDAQFGRLLDEIEHHGATDNTLIVFIQGDNGSSAEGGRDGTLFEQSMINIVKEEVPYMAARIEDIGGPKTYNNYPVGWAWAMSTPFQWYKQVASHFGGTRNGMVISWPARIRNVGMVRGQFHFVADVAPTLLAAAGVTAPREFAGVEQQPIDGIDMTYSFDDPNLPSARRVQVFSMMQHLGVFEDGWFAGTTPQSMPFEASQRRGASDGVDRKWELYDLRRDFSQARDVAAHEPQKLKQLQETFWREAERNNMLPIHSSYGSAQHGRPSLGRSRTTFEYMASTTRVPEDAAPPTVGRSFRIDADLTLADSDASGVLLAQGGAFSGYSLYLNQGRPMFHYNSVPPYRFTVAAPGQLAPGDRRVTFRFEAAAAQPGSGGVGIIEVDGIEVGRGAIGQTLVRWISHTEGLDVGADTITPVSEDYASPARFTGVIHKVTVTVQ